MRLLDVPVYSFLGTPRPKAEVLAALTRVFAERGGLFSTGATKMFASNEPAMTNVALPPAYVTAAPDVARELSMLVSGPVIVIEGDFSSYWAYYLFSLGEIVDKFATVPARVSWERGARKKYRGDAATVERVWPDLKSDRLAPYLVQWDRTFAPLDVKAQSDDEFKIGSGWQIVDVLRRFQLPFERTQFFTW